mmetsp:Transcript_43520/g.114387  ORF Transcript_43520/g.114387 Transcript_43520/m.114387 type:complete len:337 (-) Transcript_43520:300-1310(-)
MTAGGGLEQFSTQREIDGLRQRMRADRQRSDRERLELLSAMQDAMGEAKRAQAEQEAAHRRHSAFLRRCRAEADAAKSSFEKDMRRRQAFFDQSAAHAARREADRAEEAEERRRRNEHAHEYGLPPASGVLPPILIATPQQEKAYAAFEDEFASFEAAPSDQPAYSLHTMPWPPASCPVAGLRKGDASDRCKQLLKAALLRWHPDKFAAAHGGKLALSDQPMIMERVNAILRRVQSERAAFADGDEACSSIPTTSNFVPTGGYGSARSHAPATPTPDDGRRAAAAAAARYMPSSRPRMPSARATGPKVMRPSRAAQMAAAEAASPKSQKYAYDGRF